MSSPVLADDGHNYEHEWIEKYFEARERLRLPIVSIWTDLPMSRRLKPNPELRAEIQKAMLNHPASGFSTNLPTDVTSLNCLNFAFKELDQLRDVLAETLNGWKPPQLVIIGAEGTGKTSLLERLIMMPIVPTAGGFSTHLPIHVRLRNSSEARAPMLEVFNTKSNQTEQGPYLVPHHSGASAVADKMGELMQQAHGRDGCAASDRIIILHVQGPSVPTLDLVDMPGLTSAPPEARRRTRRRLEDHIRARDADSRTLYLALVPAPCGRPHTSMSMELVQAMGLEASTIGVLTHCDLLHPRDMHTLRRRLRRAPGGAEALGGVGLAPHGWIATANARPDGPGAPGGPGAGRLRRQAEAEEGFFAEHMPAEVRAGRATCGALIGTVCAVYREHLRATWARETVRRLDAALRQARAADAALGRPAAVGPGGEALAQARSAATAAARRKCEGLGGAADSDGCFRRVVAPLAGRIVAIASGSGRRRLRVVDGGPPRGGGEGGSSRRKGCGRD